MAKAHIGWDNWFLVIPGALLGLVALWTINRMYQAGDIRRSIQVVTEYEAAGQAPLGEFLEQREGGRVECAATLVSRFYGTLDVSCARVPDGTAYTWRVHVGQLAFAPSDEVTRALMREYAPTIFGQESR